MLPHPVRREPILREAEVEESGDGDGLRGQLFLLLGEVGAADEADGAFMPELGEELQQGGGDGLEGGELAGLLFGFGGMEMEERGLGNLHGGRV